MTSPKKDYDAAHAAARAIRDRVRSHGWDPSRLASGSAVQLGSGLQASFARRLGDRPLTIPYADVPHLVPPGAVPAPNHRLELTVGPLDGDEGHLVVVFGGRFHLYQGLSAEACTFYVRVVKALGVDVLGITCAAGALDDATIARGEVVMIEDTFNFTGTSALCGETASMWGEPFAPMASHLPRWIVERARAVAVDELGWPRLPSGVYLQDRGALRAYQTPFASRLFRSWGAHLVGKSTAIELEVVDDVGITRNFAMALATNYAVGIRSDLQPEVHSDHVVEEGERHAERFGALLAALLCDLHRAPDPA